jgi:hypothetical protein
MPRTIALVVVLGLLALFTLLNWTALTTPTPVSLGVTTVQAPLGLIMLGLIGCLALLFTVWAIAMQSSVLLETRRHAKELQGQRELADKAEASRFTELRAHIDAELARVRLAADEARSALTARIDTLGTEMRTSHEQAANSTAAYLGELEDRLNRLPLLPPDVPRSL